MCDGKCFLARWPTPELTTPQAAASAMKILLVTEACVWCAASPSCVLPVKDVAGADVHGMSSRRCASAAAVSATPAQSCNGVPSVAVVRLFCGG